MENLKKLFFWIKTSNELFKIGDCRTMWGDRAKINKITNSHILGEYYYESWGGGYDGWTKHRWTTDGLYLNKDGSTWERYSLSSNKKDK